VQPKPGVGNINPALYYLAQKRSQCFSRCYRREQHGSMYAGNAELHGCGKLGYSAGPGYDLATGLGSVDAYNLVTQWSNAPAVGTTTTVTANPTSIRPAAALR
jgi:hypothetical protein